VVAGGAPSGSTLWPTSISGAVDVFDANGVRTAVTNITPRAAAGITTNGTHFFVAGGFNRVSDTLRKYSDLVQIVGCDGSVAPQALSMQTERAFHASVLYTNPTTGAMQSVFAGGITESNYQLTVEVFSHNTQTWRQLSGSGSFDARRQPGAGTIGRFLVVAGGSQFCFLSVSTICSADQVDVFDLESSSTSTVQDFTLPTAALNFGVTSVSRGALLLMAGGETQVSLPVARQNEFTAVLDSVVAFNVISNTVVMNGGCLWQAEPAPHANRRVDDQRPDCALCRRAHVQRRQLSRGRLRRQRQPLELAFAGHLWCHVQRVCTASAVAS
jgi:hypothetical protein